MTLSDLLRQHEGCYCAINDCGIVADGEPNLEVTVWETERESRNDDGGRAIAREYCYGDQPALLSNGDVVLISADLIAESESES